MIYRRKSDKTLWTPTKGTDFPPEGYNFTSVENPLHRWLCIDESNFEVVE